MIKIKEKMRAYALKQLDENIYSLVGKISDNKMELEALHIILYKHLDAIEFFLAYEDDVDE